MPEYIRIGPFAVRFVGGRFQWAVPGRWDWHDDVRTLEDYERLVALARAEQAQVAA